MFLTEEDLSTDRLRAKCGPVQVAGQEQMGVCAISHRAPDRFKGIRRIDAVWRERCCETSAAVET